MMSEGNNNWKTYFQLGDVARYFTRIFRKPDPNTPSNFNLRMMHGINKISILMFLFALIVMLTRCVTR
jgi:prolipoprotein diacylglyceryltransferase